MRFLSVNMLIFCFAFLLISVKADNKGAKLSKILNQITVVRTDITQKERQQISIKQQLNGLRKKINVSAASLKETTKNLKHQKKVLLKLTENQIREQAKLKEAQNKLVSQFNLAYETEQPDYFKVIFSEEKKITPDIILVYHRYIFIARLEQMRNIKKTLERLEQNKHKIKRQTQDLEKLEKKQEKQKLELAEAEKERNQVLSTLKNKIAFQNKKLKGLLVAKRNLEKLVNTLTPHKSITMPLESRNRFCRNFVWPTKGAVTVRFGSSIEQSSWRWNGIIISIAMNQEVYAISSGKVVYANWLTGYGLLLIIDHGNGYMSLYGHNSNLHKQLNTEVLAGEVIATIGKTNSEDPGLYFAIRYGGKAIDPEKLCGRMQESKEG